MIALLLVLILSSSNRLASTAFESVDCIELNHMHDKRGKPILDQVIFYRRCPATGRFQVRAWCLVDDRECLNRAPVKNEVSGLYQVDWYDSDKRLNRTITSRVCRESWTQTDPERENKKHHDESLRVALIGPIFEEAPK